MGLQHPYLIRVQALRPDHLRVFLDEALVWRRLLVQQGELEDKGLQMRPQVVPVLDASAAELCLEFLSHELVEQIHVGQQDQDPPPSDLAVPPEELLRLLHLCLGVDALGLLPGTPHGFEDLGPHRLRDGELVLRVLQPRLLVRHAGPRRGLLLGLLGPAVVLAVVVAAEALPEVAAEGRRGAGLLQGAVNVDRLILAQVQQDLARVRS
mmetsp:Transcript_28818/g.82537  ORF Transcript_28818/g.82537 Transcript_28818/m.82537 type:complete len:209 (-) Transcript_28818:411-1037(-)